MKMHGQERNLYVDSKTLKNSLMPVTQRGLEKCRGLLQQVARDRCVHSLQEHQHKMRDLGEQPRSLRDFASYCDNVNRVRDETKEMEERAQQVNEMYELLDVYEVKIAAQVRDAAAAATSTSTTTATATATSTTTSTSTTTTTITLHPPPPSPRRTR